MLQPPRRVRPGGQLGVVRRDQGRRAALAHDLDQLGEHRLGRVRVEVAGGLVGEDEGRGVGERAGDGDALLLAAGEAGRAVGEAVGEAQPVEEVGGAAAGASASSGRRAGAA